MPKRWSLDFEPKPDDPVAPHSVTLLVDGKPIASATGIDDVFAVQNLLTKLRAREAADGDIAMVLETFNALIETSND